MEKDRYQINHKLYFVGLISLVLSLALFALSFYIMPSLLFGWFYDTPAFINELVSWLQYQHDFSGPNASKIVFYSTFMLGCFFALLAYIASNRIDNEIFKTELQLDLKVDKNISSSRSDALQLVLKITLIAILVFIVSALFEWLIYTPPPSSDADYAYYVDGARGNTIKITQ